MLSLIIAGCSSQLFHKEDNNEVRAALYELRQEIVDLRNSLRSSEISLSVVEEKVENHAYALSSFKTEAKNSKHEQILHQVSLLERKIAQLEKIQERAISDLKNLNVHTNQALQKADACERELTWQKQRLEEVSKLKTTLTSISKAMHVPQIRKHRVKPGETLDEIARRYHTTVSKLKKKNDLGSSDLIVIGQEIEIPADE